MKRGSMVRGGHLAGQLAAFVIPLRHDEPGLFTFVVEGKGAPLVVILVSLLKPRSRVVNGWAGALGERSSTAPCSLSNWK